MPGRARRQPRVPSSRGSAGSSSLRSEGLSKSREIEAKNGARQSSSALGFLTSCREFFGQGWMKLEKNERTPYIMKTTKHFNDVSMGGRGAVPFSPGFCFVRTLEVLGAWQAS